MNLWGALTQDWEDALNRMTSTGIGEYYVEFRYPKKGKMSFQVEAVAWILKACWDPALSHFFSYVCHWAFSSPYIPSSHTRQLQIFSCLWVFAPAILNVFCDLPVYILPIPQVSAQLLSTMKAFPFPGPEEIFSFSMLLKYFLCTFLIAHMHHIILTSPHFPILFFSVCEILKDRDHVRVFQALEPQKTSRTRKKQPSSKGREGQPEIQDWVIFR